MIEVLYNFDTLSVALIIITVFLLMKYSLRSEDNLPPGPTGYPVVGCMNLVKGRILHHVFRDLRTQYGDIFKLQLGSKLLIVINGYETLSEAFVKQGEDFSDRPDTLFFKDIHKEKGVVFSSGEYWKKTRTWLLKSLRNFGFGKRSLESRITEEVDEFFQVIRNQNCQPIDIKTDLQTSTANIICSICFGERYNYNDTDFNNIVGVFEENLSLNVFAGVATFFPWLKYFPGDMFKIKQIQDNSKRLKQYFAVHVKRHRDSGTSGMAHDLIDTFIEFQGSEERSDIFDDNNLLSSLENLFIGGIETTTTTIRWALMFLLHHEDVLVRMRQEIEQVVGLSRLPSLSDRVNMPYCEAVIAETLRSGNILPISVLYGAKKNFMFRNFTIPCGAVIVPNLDSVLNDPNLFPEPETFKPERFIDKDGNLFGTEKVIAFSIGRRKCLAETLARMEIFLYLTSLVQRFNILPEEDGVAPEFKVEMGTVFSPAPFKVRLVPV